MAVAGEPRRRLVRRLNAVGLVFVIALCIGVIVGLVLDVQRRLDALAKASSDSVQWALAQLEVETQLMRESLGTPDADLATVRKRFDIFFSRMMIFETSTLYAGLRGQLEFGEPLNQIGQFLDRTLPLMDGPDAGLRAGLPTLHGETVAVRDAVRAMSLTGIEYFSTESDLQRTEMARTLQRLAGVTAVLIIALSVLVTVLLRLYQRSQLQSLENRQTTARLEAIVNTSLDAIVVADRRGCVLEFNPAAETIFGYTRVEAFGKQVTSLIFPPDAIEDTFAAIETQLISAEARLSGKQRIELEAVGKDRSSFPVELSVALAGNTEGQIFVAFLRDISERLQAERDLTEARDQALKGQKAKADFLAVMSHEMRTPLNGLLGSSEILGATPLQPNQREILEVIEMSGQILLHHVNSVLDISSAEAGAIRPGSAPFVLEALVSDVVANQSGLAAAAGNRIEIVAVTEPAGRLAGDPARLRQILLNLVGNAVKFTRNGTITIEIEAEPAPGEVRKVEIRVIDSGIGIAEADQVRVFDDFVTLDSTYGREAGGTGLGLGITRRLVHALGGEIGMESEPGQGSVFWVRLPFAQDAVALPIAVPDDVAAADITGTPLSVLVIEDNAINRFVLRALLEEVSHRVTEAVDGIEGVALAQTMAHDVILMDISMPRLDGVEAARRIRAGCGLSHGARIVAVTAHALPEELDRFHAAGIDDCLIKPITRGTLARILAGRPVQALASSRDTGSEPLIDARQMCDLMARLDEKTAENLLRRFIAEGDDIVQRLLGCPPDPSAESLCHQLAGSAATFGAKRLAATLAAMAATGPETVTIPLQSSLADIWPATKAALGDRHPALLDLAS